MDSRRVRSVKEGIARNNVSRLRLLSLNLDDAKALLKVDGFIDYLDKLNDNVSLKLIIAIKNNEIPEINESEKKDYISHLLMNKSLSFYHECLSVIPYEFVYFFLKTLVVNSYGKINNKFTSDEFKIILDYAVDIIDLDDISVSHSVILRLLEKVDDEAKLKFLEKYKYGYNIDFWINAFRRFKSHDALLEAVYICLLQGYWNRIDSIKRMLHDDELMNLVIKAFAENKLSVLPSFLNDFSVRERLEFYDRFLSVSHNYQIQDEFLNKLIDDALNDEQGIMIYEQLSQLLAKNNLDLNIYNLSLNNKIYQYLDKMNGQEFLDFYTKNSYKKFKDFLKEKEEYWLREPVFTYLVNNEPEFIIENLKNLNKLEFANKKDLFFRKDVIKSLAIYYNGFSSLIVNCESYGVTGLDDFFKDDTFDFELLEKKPSALCDVLKYNPKPEFVKFAFAKGYVPSNSEYLLCKDDPALLNQWLERFKQFDAHNKDFSSVFNSISIIENDEVLAILLSKAAENLNMSFEEFTMKFNAIKKVNSEILKTLDYRLFDEKFSFLNMNKIEFLGAHKDVAMKLCELNPQELKIVKRIMSYSSSINWIDLIDRTLDNIKDYQELVDDLADKELSIEDISLFMKLVVHKNELGINTYEDMKDYRNIVDEKIKRLAAYGTVDAYREAIALSVLDLNYDEFKRINKIYCADLDNFCKISHNEDLKKILLFIKNVCTETDLNTLKEIYEQTPKINLGDSFLVNLDSLIRQNYAMLYNDTLYHVNDKDLLTQKSYKEVIEEDGTVKYVLSDGLDGNMVSFYSPIGLGHQQKDFAVMMTSLGAYSDHKEPDDYYANWNIDLIESHGFCCSYLTNDNLGTARICHAVLGFTDFAPEALLLSAPFDIASSNANLEFNTSRKTNNVLYCTPRGMVNNTRHTHNEVVWERRDLMPSGNFKKSPSYVIFFCENLNNLNEEEQKIYNSTIKAAIQLGSGKPLPVVVIEREKIAKYQQQRINDLLSVFLNTNKPGVIKQIITLILNNSIGNTYSPNVDQKYFSNNYKKTIIRMILMNIISILKKGDEKSKKQAMALYNELETTMEEEKLKFKGDDNLTPLEVFINEINEVDLQIKILFDISKEAGTLYKQMMAVVSTINDNTYIKRWNYAKVNFDNTVIMHKPVDLQNLLISMNNNNFNLNKLAEFLDELEADNIYPNDSPYNNRFVANKILYTLLLSTYDGVDTMKFAFDDLLEAIKYQYCSYMDGSDKKNINAALDKATTLMTRKGFSKDKINNIKFLISLINEKEITEEKVNEVCEKYNIDKIDIGDYKSLQKIINILHDVNCLEHVRFVTKGELEEKYMFDKDHIRYARFAYQLQEGYAQTDLDEMISGNPQLAGDIKEVLKTKNPQVVLRNLRKNRFEAPKYKNNSYEDAFLEIDAEKATDPLGLVSEKMKQYTNLPKQMSLIEFYSKIVKMPCYEYLNKKIAGREELYLNMSEIHGATHANNVSLFAAFIATMMQMSDRDIKTIIEAAIYHDIGRTNDNKNFNHGKLGAIKYSTSVKCPKDIKMNEVQLLIEAHAVKTPNDVYNLLDQYNIVGEDRDRLYRMATVIRDADALDRTRFKLLEKYNNLKVDYLINPISKEIIESVQRLNYIIYKDYVNQQLVSNQMKM